MGQRLLDRIVHDIFEGYSYSDWERLQQISSWIPILSAFKVGAELRTGRALFTGEDLSGLDETFNVVDAFGTLLGLGQVGHAVANSRLLPKVIDAVTDLGEAKRVERKLNLIAQGANKMPVESRMSVLRAQLNAVTAVKIATANVEDLISTYDTARAALTIITFAGKVSSRTADAKDAFELYQYLTGGVDAKTINGVAAELTAAYAGTTHGDVDREQADKPQGSDDTPKDGENSKERANPVREPEGTPAAPQPDTDNHDQAPPDAEKNLGAPVDQDAFLNRPTEDADDDGDVAGGQGDDQDAFLNRLTQDADDDGDVAARVAGGQGVDQDAFLNRLTQDADDDADDDARVAGGQGADQDAFLNRLTQDADDDAAVAGGQGADQDAFLNRLTQDADDDAAVAGGQGVDQDAFLNRLTQDAGDDAVVAAGVTGGQGVDQDAFLSRLAGDETHTQGADADHDNTTAVGGNYLNDGGRGDDARDEAGVPKVEHEAEAALNQAAQEQAAQQHAAENALKEAQAAQQAAQWQQGHA